MSTVVPIAPYIRREFAPGFTPEDSDAPRAFGHVRTFSPEDESAFWALDFHNPFSLAPLSLTTIEVGAILGSNLAAERIPLPTGKGLEVRMVDGHIYSTEVRVTSEFEMGLRGSRAAVNLPRNIADFPQLWADSVEELDAWFEHLRTPPAPGAGAQALAAYFEESVSAVQRAFEIHFFVMYTLLANYLSFMGLCGELGIERERVPRFLQGYETKITETDRELTRLAALAAASGLTELFARTSSTELLDALDASDPAHTAWRTAFDEFLERFGWRTEGVYELLLKPWVEDPSVPLGTIKAMLASEGEHDFDAAQAETSRERERLVTESRDALSVEEQEAFDAALASCRHANFTWWNEEHNFYIDLRAHIPLRQAALAVGRWADAADPEDAIFLFAAEVRQLLAGERTWESFADLVARRRAHRDASSARRVEMPKVLGTVPEDVDDPVLKEIFGIRPEFLRAALGQDDGDVLSGMPASAGKAVGRARVLLTADELNEVAQGEVLVCEATSPNWTPAFGRIAACVCDAGGSLTHASIVSREYRLPCVTGVAVATSRIRTGDLLEVDGSLGTVRILERAAPVAAEPLQAAGSRP